MTEEQKHKQRLDILEKCMGKTFYQTGRYHMAISSAMEEYATLKNLPSSQRIMQADRRLLEAYAESIGIPVLDSEYKTGIEKFLASNGA